MTRRGPIRAALQAFAAAVAAAALFALSLAHVLPHDGRPGAAPAGAAVAGGASAGSHAHHRDGHADPGPRPDGAGGPHCPLCTLAKAFLAPGPTALPTPAAHAEARPRRPSGVAGAPCSLARRPQQPRAPPTRA